MYLYVVNGIVMWELFVECGVILGVVFGGLIIVYIVEVGVVMVLVEVVLFVLIWF